MEVEIGRGKKARRAYGFDDIAIVPSRRTRDPDDVDISWTLGPYRFDLPLLASAMDGVVSPQTAGIVGRLGGLAVLNLEGIFTRYEDADEQLARIAQLPKEEATREMQQIYQEPVKPELIAQRIQEIKASGVVTAASLTPQKVRKYHELALDAGLDVLVIQGTVVSAEHVSADPTRPPLNLKEFIAELPVPVVVGGCASYHTGLHLMRTGAAGVLVGVGPGAACTTRGVLPPCAPATAAASAPPRRPAPPPPSASAPATAAASAPPRRPAPRQLPAPRPPRSASAAAAASAPPQPPAPPPAPRRRRRPRRRAQLRRLLRRQPQPSDCA